MPKNKSRKYYAVRVGRNPGVYDTWDECQREVTGYPRAAFKSFGTVEEAWEFVNVSAPKTVYNFNTENIYPQRTFYQQRSSSIYEDEESDIDDDDEPVIPQRNTSNTVLSDTDIRRFVNKAVELVLNKPISSSSSNSLSTVQSTLPNSIDIHFPPTAVNISLSKDIVENPTRTIQAYTDGSCFNNGSKTKSVVGGIGVHFVNNDLDDISEPYCSFKVTNQRTELAAIKTCLEAVAHIDKFLVIYSDSQYSIKCIQNWIFGWARNNWKTSQGTPVENMDLLKDIIDLIGDRFTAFKKGVQFVHVRGHQSNKGNNTADVLAVAGSRKSLLQ